MKKRFTLELNTTVPTQVILVQLEILLAEFVERDEDLIEIKHVKAQKVTKPCKSKKQNR